MANQKADQASSQTRDWRETLFLPKTDFPMKAGLPKREPGFLDQWDEGDFYKNLRASAKGRPLFILHDGPPYANGHIHIGHALNKTLKDVVARSHNMLGFDSPYIHGWDCHGLPIEWKVEEKYRQKGKDKDEVPVNEFRAECRAFAANWVSTQMSEMQRLGVQGDWENSYKTMSFDAEKTIASELIKFAMNGSLYQGFKPVMWSVVEKTALADAEVEYEEHESPTIWVKFDVVKTDDKALEGASVVIWTTTPWTIPGNRAIAYGAHMSYGLYEITAAPDDNWASKCDKLILSDALAEKVMKACRAEDFKRLQDVDPKTIKDCAHPFRGDGYDFEVRLYAGDFVTDEAGTGFVHIAPGHGADDYGLYLSNQRAFAEAGIDAVPQTVLPDGHYHESVPLFGGDDPCVVINQKGKFANANPRVIEELVARSRLLARGKMRHQYPHSWRSKAPVIFRATPQWFIAMDKPIKIDGEPKEATIRELALKAIEETQFVPEAGYNRLKSMVENRPDWVISRQRAWGVPITIFKHKETGAIIPSADFDKSDELIDRILSSFEEQGADAWFEAGAKEGYLSGLVDDADNYEQIMDILDVWFDSGSTHAFVLEGRENLRSPADLYLEGSDQHRGWFQSSLLESCGTRGRAPYKAVLTHGFTLDKNGKKMSKSKGNAVDPAKVIQQYGADILRLWVVSGDYSEDQRIGQEMLKTSADSYRKMRNTLRFLLGNLVHYDETLKVDYKAMPELERFILHRLYELDKLVRDAYRAYDYKKAFHSLFQFCTVDLSALYFDIRKDTLYCDAFDSQARKASLTVLDVLFDCLTAWLAPMLVFTMEEVWQARANNQSSVHMRVFPEIPTEWQDDELDKKWQDIRRVRRVVTGALEIERREKRIGSSLESAPEIYIADEALYNQVKDQDWAEIAITSDAKLIKGAGPKDSFFLEDDQSIVIVPKMAEGQKCARSWKISPDVGAVDGYPDLSPRDAKAVQQFDEHFATN